MSIRRLLSSLVVCLLCMSSSAQLKVAMSHADQLEIAKKQEKMKQDSLYKEKQKNHYDSLQAYPVEMPYMA